MSNQATIIPVDTAKNSIRVDKELYHNSIPSSGDLVFGERLYDDIIDSFCRKLKAAAPVEIEGLLPIQQVLRDQGEASSSFTGKNVIFQILFDTERNHYILVMYSSVSGCVEIFDSLQQYDKVPETDDHLDKVTCLPRISKNIQTQIYNLFSKLSENSVVTLLCDPKYEHQEDSFSCGYRAIGALLSTVQEICPVGHQYDLEKIMELLKVIESDANPPWSVFEKANVQNYVNTNPSFMYMTFLRKSEDGKSVQHFRKTRCLMHYEDDDAYEYNNEPILKDVEKGPVKKESAKKGFFTERIRSVFDWITN